jgi:hypothetical protein
LRLPNFVIVRRHGSSASKTLDMEVFEKVSEEDWFHAFDFDFVICNVNKRIKKRDYEKKNNLYIVSKSKYHINRPSNWIFGYGPFNLNGLLSYQISPILLLRFYDKIYIIEWWYILIKIILLKNIFW